MSAMYYNVFSLFPFTKRIPFTAPGCERFDDGPVELKSPGFSHFASFLMAIDHFNSRNTVVVPEIVNFRSCGVKLNITGGVWDSESSPSTAVAMFMKQVNTNVFPDLVIGGYNELPVADLSVVTSGLGIPYVAYGSSSMRVVTPFLHPFSTRTSVDKTEIIERVRSYLIYRGRKDFISIFYASSDVATQLQLAMEDTLNSNNIRHSSISYVPPLFCGSEQGMHEGLEILRQNGYRTILLFVDSPEEELPLIAQVADDLEMNDGSYFWLIAGISGMNYFLESKGWDSITAKLLAGAVVIYPLDGFMYDAHDRFLEAWNARGLDSVRSLNEIYPISPGEPGYFLAEDSYFQETIPDHGSSFVYDAVMAAGMGICMSSGRERWVPGIRKSSFHGASGYVSFGADPIYPGGRSAGTVGFGAFNLLPPNSNESFILTDVFASTNNANTASLGWQSRAPFFYAGGTSYSSAELRTLPEQNYLNPGIRCAGLALWAIALVFIFSSFMWVIWYRNHKVVKASQPAFLLIMILGCFLISIAIFTNSWDESYGWNTEQLSVLCTSTPWLVILGVMLIYCSLFSKLWRVNKVLSFRRRRVKVHQVVWPAAVLLLSALCLLSIWTALEGFDWVRIELNSVTGESIGKCKGEQTVAYFTPIFLLTVLPCLLTLFMAFKTRDVDQTYSEANWIFILILLQIQVLLIAIPVFRILEVESSNGRYMAQIMVFWIFSMSPILLIIAPKAWKIHFQKDVATKSVRGQRASAVRVSGVNDAVVNSLRSSVVANPRKSTIQHKVHTDSSSSPKKHDVGTKEAVVSSFVSMDTTDKTGAAEDQGCLSSVELVPVGTGEYEV